MSGVLASLRGHWFVACTTSDLRKRVVGRMVLGVPIALFRSAGVAVALAVKIAAPLLIVHGTADRSIPYDFGRRLFALAESRKPSSPIPRVARSTPSSRASCNGSRG